MARENQITINEGDDKYSCDPCDRYFQSTESLLQHCRSKHKAEWCERCQWLFVSNEAYRSHAQKSCQHCLCSFCDEDFRENEELSAHQSDRHMYCDECQVIFQDYTRHRVEHHWQCVNCSQEFTNSNNLKMVRYRKLSIPCANGVCSICKYICPDQGNVTAVTGSFRSTLLSLDIWNETDALLESSVICLTSGRSNVMVLRNIQMNGRMIINITAQYARMTFNMSVHCYNMLKVRLAMPAKQNALSK